MYLPPSAVQDDVEIHTPGAPPEPVHFPLTVAAFTVKRVERRATNVATIGSFMTTRMIELLWMLRFWCEKRYLGTSSVVRSIKEDGKSASLERLIDRNGTCAPTLNSWEASENICPYGLLKRGGDEISRQRT
ncbi:hypothetical protein FRC18_002860 [Serendipita sp. 400]|nr:hypothetical protein FRC18_002860 [Serendipita sp. 400]